MTDIDERIKSYKRDALIIYLEGEYWHSITLAKWEEAYLKELQEEKARTENETHD
jgi:hypothetical protein